MRDRLSALSDVSISQRSRLLTVTASPWISSSSPCTPSPAARTSNARATARPTHSPSAGRGCSSAPRTSSCPSASSHVPSTGSGCRSPHPPSAAGCTAGAYCPEHALALAPICTGSVTSETSFAPAHNGASRSSRELTSCNVVSCCLDVLCHSHFGATSNSRRPVSKFEILYRVYCSLCILLSRLCRPVISASGTSSNPSISWTR